MERPDTDRRIYHQPRPWFYFGWSISKTTQSSGFFLLSLEYHPHWDAGRKSEKTSAPSANLSRRAGGFVRCWNCASPKPGRRFYHPRGRRRCFSRLSGSVFRAEYGVSPPFWHHLAAGRWRHYRKPCSSAHGSIFDPLSLWRWTTAGASYPLLWNPAGMSLPMSILSFVPRKRGAVSARTPCTAGITVFSWPTSASSQICRPYF